MDPVLTKFILTALDWTLNEFNKSKGGGIIPKDVLEAQNAIRKALAEESQSKAKRPYTRKLAIEPKSDTSDSQADA
jgi:hypothetical protein